MTVGHFPDLMAVQDVSCRNQGHMLIALHGGAGSRRIGVKYLAVGEAKISK